MSRRYLARMLPVVLVAVALSTPLAWGAPSPSREAARQDDLLSRVWTSLTVLWAQTGCKIDPHGGCTSSGTDAGCIIDPNGRCADTEFIDAGCIADPNGGCTGGQSESLAPSSDEGCILDPHGGCRPES